VSCGFFFFFHTNVSQIFLIHFQTVTCRLHASLYSSKLHNSKTCLEENGCVIPGFRQAQEKVTQRTDAILG
jgi:hypothetical protein